MRQKTITCVTLDLKMLGARAFAETVCSPHALAKWLDAEGLNDAIQIHFDTAVRSFLPKRSFDLRDGGIWVGERCYSNTELDESSLYASLSPGQTIKVSGYHLPLNLMYVWVEISGRLRQLKPKLSVRLGEREQMLTMEELEEKPRSSRNSHLSSGRSAAGAELEARKRYEENAGASWGRQIVSLAALANLRKRRLKESSLTEAF